MIKFRRKIALFMLTLVVCQSVMAAIGEDLTLSFGDEAIAGFHIDQLNHFDDGKFDPHHSGEEDLLDTNCCHAHGHCHAMAFVSKFANSSHPSGLGITDSYEQSYQFLYLETLLRPPSRV